MSLPTARLDKAGTYTIQRDGDQDISCDGWLIGLGSSYDVERNSTRWAEVRIMLTVAGTLVTQVARLTDRLDEHNSYAVAIHQDSSEAIAWLDCYDDTVHAAAVRAWEEARECVPALEPQATERID